MRLTKHKARNRSITKNRRGNFLCTETQINERAGGGCVECGDLTKEVQCKNFRIQYFKDSRAGIKPKCCSARLWTGILPHPISVDP